MGIGKKLDPSLGYNRVFNLTSYVRQVEQQQTIKNLHEEQTHKGTETTCSLNYINSAGSDVMQAGKGVSSGEYKCKQMNG